LLKEVVSHASRVAVLISPLGGPVREALTKAAKPFGVQLQFVTTPELRLIDSPGARCAGLPIHGGSAKAMAVTIRQLLLRTE
jgi:hypothetical protein